MKYLIHICFIAAILSSCQKDTTETFSPKNQLAFNLSLDQMPLGETRAADADTDLNARGFYLAGYHTEGGMETAAAEAFPNVFDHDAKDNQAPVPLVTMVNNKFTLQTIKWALDEATCLSFFGWSQSKAIPTSGVTATTTGIVGQTTTAADKGYPWIDIRNADAPADQADVVGSRSLDHRNDAVLSAVDLDFKHLLSKLTFKAKSTSKANIVFTAVNLKYATNKVYKKARYTFGSNAMDLGAYGSFAEYHTGTVALTTTPPTMNNGAEVTLGCGMLIPQALAAGDVSLEIKYKLSPNSGGLPGVEQTKTLPLSAFTFAQGKNYVYTIDVQASDIVVMSNPVIEPWAISGTSMPVIPGPKGDVILLLDGYDKPYQHTNGKWYWLDRSGYNRHVEIEGYAAGMYNANEHSYVMDATRNLKVPVLPSLTALTTDIVCQQTTTPNHNLLSFAQSDNLRRFYVEMSYLSDNKIYFDCMDPITLNHGRIIYQGTVAEFQTKTLWSFQKQDGGTAGTQYIYKNGQSVASSSDSGPLSLGVLTNNNIGNKSYVGKVSYVKLTAKMATLQDIQDVYFTVNQRFGVKNDLPEISGPRGDLQLLLLGTEAPYTHTDGNKYWLDHSGYNRHVLLRDRFDAYDAANKCYKFKNTSTGDSPYGGMIPPLSTGEYLTVDIITDQSVDPGTNKSNMVFNLSSKSFAVNTKSTAQARMLITYVNSGDVYVYTRSNTEIEESLWQKWFTVPGGNDASKLRGMYTLISNPNRMAVLWNAGVLADYSGSGPGVIGDLKYNSLAPEYAGNISLVKITRRERTPLEIQADFATYVDTYNIIDNRVGLFAGTLKTETVGTETHYYYNKMLYAAPVDEASTYKWANASGNVGAASAMDGYKNTYTYLNNSAYPAGYVCAQRTPGGAWYLPAQDQILAVWLALPALGIFDRNAHYWSSTQSSSSDGYAMRTSDGKVYSYGKAEASKVRCVREATF